MPKSVKKSCITQTSISRYFVGVNSRSSNSTKEKSAENLSRSKQKHSSGGDEFGLPKKRAKLSLQDHQGAFQCSPSSYQSNEESTSTLDRGAGSLCSSTLEKLKGFACLTSESSVGHGATVKDRNMLDDAQIKVPDKKSFDGTEQHFEENKRRELDKENEKEEDRSWVTDSEQGFTSSEKDGHAEDSNPLSNSVAKSRRSKNVHASRVYTPLEQQVIQLKEQHKDALLAVECGYKYRFFGDDAEIAAKELNIFCHLDHNFMTCSIPTHRLFVHVRRLVSHGHKVGVVKQTETSAIKASGTSRNSLFTRQLSGLYTKSTLVGEDVNPVCRLGDVAEGSSSDAVLDPPESFLLCISETWDKLRKHLTVGLVAVQPSTGDMLVDSFPDGSSRSELEGRVVKINPVEIIIPSDASEATHRLIQSVANASAQADDRVRVEKRDCAQFEFASAMNTVTEFYCHSQEQGCRSLSSVASLESPVICCLGPLIQYLREFNLERVLRSESSFQRLSSASEGMTLNAATLRNLEILNNQTDGGVKGSLLWVLDHTRTHFGRRMLRKWVSQPLTETESVLQRLDAVQEILESNCITLNSVRSFLSHLPDLDRGICSIYHRKINGLVCNDLCSCGCTIDVMAERVACALQSLRVWVHKRAPKQAPHMGEPLKLQPVTDAMNHSHSLARLSLELQALLPAIRSQVRTPLLQGLLLDTPNLLAPAQSFLKVLNEKAAKSGNKTELFSDLSAFPVLQERREQIQAVINEIHNHRKEIRLILKAPAFDYTTVSGQEFLIEVKNSLLSTVPPEWVKVSSTKVVSRYHTPLLMERYKKLLQLREQLLLDCQTEWIHFLDQFGEHYHLMKRAISHLATLDCLFSLAEVAKQGDYCRPEVSENWRQIVIRDGRHPAIDLLMGENNQYVPNVTELQGDGKRTMIITGPNMGGKSSYIRQVALICVMAQMGSYVPASQAHLGILDGIYVRMGASDNIFQRRSTFMEELSEASEIVSRATERSLVILDELGRGTSTHDGIAIAYATLEYFIREVKALTLFVTHYPPLCELEHVYPEHVSNYHMAFLLNEPDVAADADDAEVAPEFITFLYQLTEGAAGRSYGLNVARLADIPDPILHTAARKAQELESTVNARRRKKKLLSDLWRVSDRSSLLEWQQSNP